MIHLKKILALSCILLSSCSIMQSGSQSHPSEAKLPTAAKTKLTKKKHSLVDPSYLQTSRILEHVSNKVYQILIKKKKDFLVSYKQDFPQDLLPFEQRKSEFMSIGSAFSITPGHFLTCAHVFNLHLHPNPEEFFLQDDKGVLHQISSILRYSIHRDVAEFTLQDSVSLPTLPVAPKADIGDPVFSIGNALGIGISVRSGVFSSYSYESNFGEWSNIRFSAPASPGNSGGPLVNDQGEVLGIIQAKSENENLNYAYPINLLPDVTTHFAQIKTRQQFSPYGIRDVFVIDFSEPKLPMDVASLQRQLYSRFQQEIFKQADIYFNNHKKDFFSDDPKVNQYLYFQNIGNFWHKITKYRNNRYISFQPEYKSEILDSGDTISYASTGSNDEGSVFHSQFVYELKDITTLADLMVNPAPIMAQVFNLILGPIKIGNVTIDLKSFKSSDETLWYSDHLARPWRIDIWRMQTYELTYITACTAQPKGLACLLFPPMTSQLEAYGPLALIKYELESWMVSPTGTIDQWQHYLKLPEKYQWPLLKNATIKFNPVSKNESQLFAFFPPYKLDLKLQNIFERLELSVSMAYFPTLPLRARMVGLGIYDTYGHNNFFTLPQLQPNASSDENEKMLYQQTLLKHGEFNGEVSKDKSEKKIILVGQWQKNKLELLPVIDPKNATSLPLEIQTIFCYSDLHHSDLLLKTWCEDFVKSFSWQESK